MKRNLDHRLEILFPVRDPAVRRRVLKILEVYFVDNVKARELRPDGKYAPVAQDGDPVRAQETFYREAVAAVRSASRTTYRPLTSAKSNGADTTRQPGLT